MGTLAIQPNSRRGYALALALLVLSLAVHWSLRPLLGAQVPFLFLFPAIGIASMWGGWRPGLLVFAAGLVHGIIWLHGTGPWMSFDAMERVAIGGYLLAGAVLTAMGGRISTLRARAAAAEDSLNEQVQDLRALHELNGRIALLPELHSQLQAVLETLRELQGADKGLLSLCEPGEAALRVAASVGFSEAALKGPLAAVPVGAGACGLAYAEGRPVAVEDAESDPRFAAYRELARSEGFRAVHSRPLVARSGCVFGTIALHYAQPRALSAREQRLGDLCAGIAAALAERDEALRRAVASSRRLEVALQTSAVPFCLLAPVRDAEGGVSTFRWTYVNAAAARALGRPAAELSGQAVRSTLQSGVALDPGLLPSLIAALRQGGTAHFDAWAERDGRRTWFELIASPHEDGLAVWFSDVTERRRQEQALRDADQRKDEFLATLAHELRNPLAPVRQAALIARSPRASEEKKQWSYGVIERQVGHMAMLLDDLLDVSRITRGKLELRRQPTPLSEIAELALETMRPQFEARRQPLRVDLPATPVWLDADRLRLAQVLSNLLANASKFTPDGGLVELAARVEGGEVVVEVRDQGAGIAADALERIFEMFTQVRAPDAGRTGGLGIGLALSRGLVELHGGRLMARSGGVGQGSTFTVRLPVGQAPAAAVPAQAPQAAGTRAQRVLVADDNRDAAQSLADLLRMEGHEVAVAFDGEEALRTYERFAPDIALVDIGMPCLTGNEVAQAIRRRPDGDKALLVAITGWGQERDRAAARAAGFDRHFTKPVDPQQVLQLVSAHSAAAAGEAVPGAVLPPP
jgi:signal transduction histidine kinase/CheY-like chemotaxis protein